MARNSDNSDHRQVSDERLHQHTGSENAFGGYEKQTDGHGNFWMQSTDRD